MRLLIVEDEIKISTFIKKGFEAQGYAVDTAFDGEQALYLAGLSEYEVILLDIMIPKINGFDVCVELRKRGIKSPVLMLSGRGETNDKISGLDCGADDYMTKPFSFLELHARVRALSRRKYADPRIQLQVRDLVMDLTRRQVLRGENFIELSHREFMLLQYLMRNAGKVVDRFSIIEHVWGEGEAILTNVVDVHIRNLRLKLDAGESDSIIHTIRGIGYMVE